MRTVAEVAQGKKGDGQDRARPCPGARRGKPRDRAGGDAFAPYVKNLYGLIFELSRNYESMLMGERSPLGDRIEQACREGEGKRSPGRALVACQGT